MNQHDIHKNGKAPAPRVAVVGASADRSKYGNRAVRAYRAAGWQVYAVNPKGGRIEGLPTYARLADIPVALDRATVYLAPDRTLGILEDLAAKGVPEIYLNPGSESPAVVARGQELGLNLILACSIVAIGRSPAQPD